MKYKIAMIMLATACSDPTPPDHSTEASTSTQGSTTSDASTASVDVTSSGSTATTAQADDSTSTSTTSDDRTSSTSTDGHDSTTDAPPVGGYGDCANDPGLLCELPEEACLYSGEVGVCAFQDCGGAADCPIPDLQGPVPPVDDPAFVACFDVTGRGTPECYIDCSVSLTGGCPEGMTCNSIPPVALCLWPVLPVGGGACPDEDLGSLVPQTVMGNTNGLIDDHYSLCGFGAGAEDAQYSFTAPAAGMYTFDTIGSGYDTVLAVLDSCGALGELGCGDDQIGSLSSVTIDLAEGQTVIVVVDGYSGATGPYTLNIAQAPAIVAEPDPSIVFAKQQQHMLVHGITYTHAE